jgi:S1-C subfamily serine protease
MLLSCGCVAAPTQYEPVAVSTESRVAPDSVAVRVDGMERHVREATLRVRNRTCLGVGTGSGFAIDDHLLVTNRHVVDGADVLQVSTWQGDTLDVTVNGYALGDDLALVETRQPLPETLELGGGVSAGDQVAVVGYPEGRRLRFAEGEVIDRVDGVLFGESARILRLTNEVRPGNSGGPLVDEDGAVVGVVFAIEIATGYGLAVPVKALKKVMNRRDFFINPSPC